MARNRPIVKVWLRATGTCFELEGLDWTGLEREKTAWSLGLEGERIDCALPRGELVSVETLELETLIPFLQDRFPDPRVIFSGIDVEQVVQENQAWLERTHELNPWMRLRPVPTAAGLSPPLNTTTTGNTPVSPASSVRPVVARAAPKNSRVTLPSEAGHEVFELEEGRSEATQRRLLAFEAPLRVTIYVGGLAPTLGQSLEKQ